MKRFTQKALAIMLTVIMVFGAVPLSAFATPRPQAGIDNGDYTMTATNSVGEIITEAFKSSELNPNGGYNVSGLDFDGKTVTVTGFAEENCALIVALFDEDSDKMLASGMGDFLADSRTATVEIDIGTMPNYYVARAFLLDADGVSLCKEYSTSEHTREFEEFYSKTTDDFDDDKVINLDDDKETNFVVLKNDASMVDANETVNKLVSVDEETETYVFQNINSEITSLKAGDIFYYNNGSETDVLIIKIKAITINGGTATIVEDDAEMVDFFDYVKIEGASNASDAEVDMTNADEGVLYTRVEEETEGASSADEKGEIAQGFDYDATKSVSYEFSIDEKEIGNHVKLSFLLKFKIEASINVYYDSNGLKKDYLEMSFKIEPSVGVEFSITGTAEKSFVKLGDIGFYICPGVYLGFTPEFVVEVSGSITVSGTIKGCLGFGYNSDEGFKDLSDPFEFEPKVEIEVTIFVGINMKPHIAIVHEKIADASVSAKIGFEIKAAKDFADDLDNDIKHDCSLCIDGDISFVIEFSAEIKLLNSKKWTYKATLWDKKIKIADFYISVPYGFGWGTCPHKYYEVSFTVADSAYEKTYSNAKIYAGLLSGLITGSFNVGLHTYQLVSDNYFVFNSGALVKNASVEGKSGARYYPEGSTTWSGSTAQTGANGKAKLFFRDGVQTATVSAPGYKSQEVEFTMNQADKSLVVFLDKKSESGGSVTGVSLDEKSLLLTVSETAPLAATIEPADATDKSVTWSSSNENVATVSQSGLVTAKALGTATITVNANDKTNGTFSDTCTVTVSAAHTWQVGDIGKFGSYPQSRVTDATLLTALNAQALTWVSYGYYSGTGDLGTMTQGDYMKYADVTYSGSKYRAVRFTSYRPYVTWYTSSSSNTNQDENGYSTNTTYWFKYEPLLWRVLDPSTGLVMCENIIDSQAYSNTTYWKDIDGDGSSDSNEYFNNSASTVYANDYATSSIRTWINNDFYNTSFTSSEKSVITTTTLDNSAWPGYSQYNSASTNDKLFLLSYSDSLNTAYGFSSSISNYDTARRAQGSDYAKCQGLYKYSAAGEYYGNSDWWLRSPGGHSSNASNVSHGGHVYTHYYVNGTHIGVRPAFKISNLSSLIFTSSKSKSETAASVGTKSARAVLTASGSSSGKSYVTCGGATVGNRYTLIVTTGTLDNLTPSSLLYIGQQTAAGTSLCFGFTPRTSEAANAYITGSFSGGTYSEADTVMPTATISPAPAELNYKSSATLTAALDTSVVSIAAVKWSSDNANVATVDENGKVYAAHRGSAIITAEITADDGSVYTAQSTVTVKYSFFQWILVILLFGWIWY